MKVQKGRLRKKKKWKRKRKRKTFLGKVFDKMWPREDVSL